MRISNLAKILQLEENPIETQQEHLARQKPHRAHKKSRITPFHFCTFFIFNGIQFYPYLDTNHNKIYRIGIETISLFFSTHFSFFFFSIKLRQSTKLFTFLHWLQFVDIFLILSCTRFFILFNL